MPTSNSPARVGCGQIEWMPGTSKPPPNHSARPGCIHSGSTSCHDSAPSAERNNPPGKVPAQSVPCAPSSAQICCNFQAMPATGSPSGWGG